ncbi:MAG: valine--tRNA ligase [Clostridiales bacterium]|nr:valine--tRNA ligase [Clostridiales bacterium]
MENNLTKTYNPKEFEERIYHKWEENGCFRAVVDYSKKPFTIVMPPPNITGQLHMGHALDQTLQDVLTRWKRMQGFNALWLPGSDHASIATEVKVAEKIKNDEGKTKEELGREEFLKRAWEWKETYGGRITEQIRKLGNSCDWERERFTMDEGCSKAVTEVFVRLYEKGLIYRGNRLINWCPSCETSLSDIEVEHEDKSGKYYYIKYPLIDAPDEFICIATTRPETMFGDTAVAVHPDDKRYQHLIGRKVLLPIADREIEIIADEYPDMEKGTGAVKITPAHDPNDFIVGERHNLEKVICMNENATMNKNAGKYEGMDRYACRKLLVKELEEKGYLVKIEETTHSVGACYRCDTVIEPMLSDQWFVKMEELAKPAIEVAKDGRLQHVPERFGKIYLHWLENIKDWCISRQLWWGHRIPAYYCEDCGEIIVSRSTPERCTKCASSKLKQDEDVLDTWFSSGLWPFSTLGWPEETEDLKYFYPTDVLVTGYDIIFFWVIRMVFSGLEQMGDVPFKYVYVHGLVRDEEGRKMSKSLGNGVDPLEIIGQYGADALRFMLMTGITPGNDVRFKTDKLESSRNFANKLWNASRFVLMNIQGDLISEEKAEKMYLDEDKWILSRINSVIQEVTTNMDKFELGMAAQKTYDFIWSEYCDWYIEMVKSRLYGEDEADKDVARYVLIKVLKDMLKLLHPFMPFITEEIWSHLPETDVMLIKESWPEYNQAMDYSREEEKIELIMDVIRAIRNIRAEAETPPSKKLNLVIMAQGKERDHISKGERYIKALANILEISIVQDKKEIPEDAMSSVIRNVEIFITLDELVDFNAEVERLEKERDKLQKEIERVDKKLSNEGFISKAPQSVVDEEKDKRIKYQEMLEKVTERLEIIKRKIG